MPVLKQATIICTHCRCGCKDNTNLFWYFANQQAMVLAIEHTPQIPDGHRLIKSCQEGIYCHRQFDGGVLVWARDTIKPGYTTGNTEVHFILSA